MNLYGKWIFKQITSCWYCYELWCLNFFKVITFMIFAMYLRRTSTLASTSTAISLCSPSPSFTWQYKRLARRTKYWWKTWTRLRLRKTISSGKYSACWTTSPTWTRSPSTWTRVRQPRWPNRTRIRIVSAKTLKSVWHWPIDSPPTTTTTKPISTVF